MRVKSKEELKEELGDLFSEFDWHRPENAILMGKPLSPELEQEFKDRIASGDKGGKYVSRELNKAGELVGASPLHDRECLLLLQRELMWEDEIEF